ncbi:unnamed protein product, partial [Prunus brigantina]
LGERAPWRARDGSSAREAARFSAGSHQPGQAQGQLPPGLQLESCDVSARQGKTKKRKTITHGSSSEQCPQSVPVVRSVSEIMALLRPLKENTPLRHDPVEPPPPMMELSLYSIVSDYEDQEYFNCMISE